jgi:hypothetical protein
MKKSQFHLHGKIGHFLWKSDQGGKQGTPLTLKYCSNLCGDLPISDFRRTSILRKPLFI